MSSIRRVLLSLALLAAATGAACGDPPDKELQQAQSAIDAARAAGAEQFAHDEFAAAQDALKRAHEAVDQRDYRLALNNALDARERAQTAAKEAADRKQSARANAERALKDATAALGGARATLRAAEAARAPARKVAAARLAITDGENAVQKARTTFDGGDYLAVIDVAASTAARLRQTTRDLDAASPAAPTRRRPIQRRN